MPICHKNKFIFFHIPRCAGTSFEVLFEFNTPEQLVGVIKKGKQVITLHHLTPIDLKHSGLVDEATMDSYFKFTIIRDPFDRMASDYLWQQKYDAHKEFSGMTFDKYLQFAERVINEGLYFEKKHYDHFRPMIMYCVHENQLLIDDVLLVETLDADINRIQSKIGNIRLPKINPSSDYEHLRTPENVARVYQIYAPDKALYDNIVALNQNYL